MPFDITKVKPTSKLMILQGGCTNFRSVGEEMIINYAEHKSLLCCADQNGAGKSTLFEHLPLYAITGGTSSKSDKVDALVNTTIGKKMECFLIWFFAGTYYKVIRGRKPSRFDLYSLINNKWVEIANLPVDNKGRQELLYSLMGLDRKTASNVIENTILLSGQRFKGFSSLSVPERRDLIEPILDLAIFSSLNAETKSLRTDVVVEQKQTYLEVTEAKLQLALVSQDVEHKEQNIEGAKASYNEQREVLVEKVASCTKLYEDSLEVDTSGEDLHVGFEDVSEELATEENNLTLTFNSDLSSLGEFVVDESDKVLVKLNSDLASIDQTITSAKEALELKRDSLSEEVVQVKAALDNRLFSLKKDYNGHLLISQENYKDELEDAQSFYDKSIEVLNKVQEDYAKSVEYYSDCSINVDGLTQELKEVTERGVQYQTKCDNLSEAIVFLEAKRSQEVSNLDGLVHAGVCPSCKSHLSEEYVCGLKEELNTKIANIDADITLYNERLEKGKATISDLGISELHSGLHVAKLQLDSAKPSEALLLRAKQTLDKADGKLKLLNEVVVGEGLTQRFEVDSLNLQNQLDVAEAQIKDSLCELETEYKLLVKAKPTKVENIVQQRLDRVEALKGEFGGRERNLKSVYNLSVANIQEKLKTSEKRLQEGLDWLVKNKNSNTLSCEIALQEAKDCLQNLDTTHNTFLSVMKDDYDKTLTKQFCKATDLSELTKLHDKQQQDIEDYNDLLMLLSDKEGKADIVKNILPQLNKGVNTYLEAMGMFISLEIDSEFNLTMQAEDRKGQSLFSLSAGQKSKVDLALLLSLRDLASSKESVACNLLILDEILEPFSAEALQDIILMLQERFTENNIVLITQRGEEVKDLFTEVKQYGLRGGFTVELENEE